MGCGGLDQWGCSKPRLAAAGLVDPPPFPPPLPRLTKNG